MPLALPLRTDAKHVRATLAIAFAQHVGDLWPQGDPNASPAWIANNVDSIFATRSNAGRFSDSTASNAISR